MATVLKTDPVGLDVFLNSMQISLFNFLTTDDIKVPWTKYESFHRAYKNPKNGLMIPEIYTADGEYKDILFNDEFNVTSFFLADDTRTDDLEIITQRISIIFQGKLDKLYPLIDHRADEEMNFDILNAVKAFPPMRDKDITMVTGIRNVYAELNLNNLVDFDDMSKFHVVKVDVDATYYSGCENVGTIA